MRLRTVIGILIGVAFGAKVFAQHPNCSNNSIYAKISNSLVVFSNSLPPSTVTPILLAAGPDYFAIAPSFSFPTTNPTFWATASDPGGRKLLYHNGINWSYAPHNFQHNIAYNLAGNQNYLYASSTISHSVYIYNGTSNPIFQGTLTLIPQAIRVDDQGNLYGLTFFGVPSPSIIVYNSQLVPICGYSLVGYTAGGPNIFSIQGNTVNIGGFNNSYYIGLINGSTINFTQTTQPALGTNTTILHSNSCHRITTFSSSVSSASGPSLYCQQIKTLAVNSSSNAVSSFQWSGPGLLGVGNASNASVYLPGVYTCTLLTSDCPPFRSISSYTVIDAGGFFTPSLSTTGSISCTNPTTQIVANHNSALHTFSWTGPGILSSPTNSLISVNAAGVYSVMITNTLSGCTMTAQIGMADGIGPLDISNSGGNLFLCTPVSPQTLTVSGAGSYTWSPNIAISSTLGAVVTITPGGSPVYTISGSLGVCSGSTVLGVYVTPSPTVTTAISNTTVCSGAPAYLSAGGNAYAYTWYPGGINGASVVVTPTATTIYTVSGNYGGCLTNAEVTVHVNPKPSITVNAVHPYVCIGMSNTFSASGAQNITWYPGGIVSNSLVVTPNFTGNVVYTVTGTSTLGCAGSFTFYVLSAPGPLNITPTNPAVCSNQTTMLGANTIFSTYIWSGPNIVSSGQNTVIVSPSVTSIYTLQASTILPYYCERTGTISVTAYSLPVIGIVASSTNLCAGTQLTLTPSGAVNYSLGIPAQQTGTLFTLTPPGSTIYTIYGSDGFGCKNTNTVQIVVTPTPNVSANTPNVNLCPRDTAVIVASGANSYTWHPGALTGNTVQVSPLSTTIYTVSGSIGNCVRSTTLLLNAVQSPTVNLTSSNAGVCPGNSITILANGASNYTWLPGNTNGSGLTLVGTATASGQYSVFGTNAYNCRDTAYVNFYIIPNPTVLIVAQPTVLCVGDTCFMLANGATNYTWQPGNHVGTSYKVLPFLSTIYTIAGTNGSCTTSSSIAIQVNPYPNLGVVSNPSIVCSGGQSTLTAFGASSYSWVSMAQTSQSIVVVPTGTSIYSVIGTSQACSSTQTLLVQVYTNSLQVVSPSVICRGESATITASGALTYTWSSVNNSPQLVVYPIADTILVLSSTDANNCQTQVTITILVSECVSLGELDEARQIRIYPNPNQGDFTLLWEQQQAGTRLRIFNNLGQLVLEEPVIFTSQKINFNRFDKGLYTLDLIFAEQVIFRTKLVKE